MGISKDMKEGLREVGKVEMSNWHFEGVKNIEMKRGGSLDIYEFTAKDSNPHVKELEGEPIGLFERDLTAKGNNEDGYTFLATRLAVQNAIERAKKRLEAARAEKNADE